MTAADRKRAERLRRRALGLKPYEVWLRPTEWPRLKQFLDYLIKGRTP